MCTNKPDYKMTEAITFIKRGHLYIPKRFLEKAGFKLNDRVILRVTNHGIAFCKVTALDELDVFFNEIDESLKRLFIAHKNKELKHPKIHE